MPLMTLPMMPITLPVVMSVLFQFFITFLLNSHEPGNRKGEDELCPKKIILASPCRMEVVNAEEQTTRACMCD